MVLLSFNLSITSSIIRTSLGKREWDGVLWFKRMKFLILVKKILVLWGGIVLSGAPYNFVWWFMKKCAKDVPREVHGDVPGGSNWGRRWCQGAWTPHTKGNYFLMLDNHVAVIVFYSCGGELFTVNCLNIFHFFLGTERGLWGFCRTISAEYGLTHTFGLLGKRYILSVQPRVPEVIIMTITCSWRLSRKACDDSLSTKYVTYMFAKAGELRVTVGFMCFKVWAAILWFRCIDLIVICILE
jgi:hypothetical protein